MEKNYLFIHAVFDPVEQGEGASLDAPGERIGARVGAVCFDGLYAPAQVFPIVCTTFVPDYGTKMEYRLAVTGAGNGRAEGERRYRLSNCELPFETPLTAGDNATRPIGAVQNSRTFHVTHTGPMPSWGSFPQFSYSEQLPAQREERDKVGETAVCRMALSPTPDVANGRIMADYPLRSGNGKEGQN